MAEASRNLLDFGEAFDNRHCDGLWTILRMHGIPQDMADIIKTFCAFQGWGGCP